MESVKSSENAVPQQSVSLESAISELAFSLSPTMEEVIEELAGKEHLSATTIVNAILKRHPEYADKRADGLRIREDAEASPQRGVIDWLHEVGAQFEFSSIESLKGRFTILGLSRLDAGLKKELMADDFLELLKAEIKPSFEETLSPEGRRIWGLRETLSEKTYLHLDNPAIEDELGRKPLAVALALLLRYIRKQIDDAGVTSRTDEELDQGVMLKLRRRRGWAKSEVIRVLRGRRARTRGQGFMINLYGPWGSGKSTMLHFLREQLTAIPDHKRPRINNEKWIVVNYNAWQNQRINPPWWPLMDAVYRQARAGLGCCRKVWLWLSETWWRFRVAFTLRLLAILVLAFVVGAALVVNGSPKTQGTGLPETQDNGSPETQGDQSILIILERLLGSMEGLLGAVIALSGVAYTLSRTLLPGSASAAQAFTEISSDPLSKIAGHFSMLIRRIKHPVIVFIDDLDRCDADYVVTLLEGIQTLFRAPCTFYVVAADMNWLRASYANAYGVFSRNVSEPGHPMDHLFMEKVFQLSVPVPKVEPDYHKQYWGRLVSETGVPDTGDRPDQDAYDAAKAKFRTVTTESDLLAEVDKVKGKDVEPFYRAEAVKYFVSPDVQSSVHHRLMRYDHLVGSNPRTMKRLVNAYTIHQLLVLLSGNKTPPEVLPLWLILEILWPSLAEQLMEHPEWVNYFHEVNKYSRQRHLPRNLDKDLRELIELTEVRDVVTGKGMEAKLEQRWIEECARLTS